MEDKRKLDLKAKPTDIDSKMRPELLQAFKKSQERYDQLYKNLRDR